MLCHAMLRYAMLCYAMLCCAMVWYGMPCYAMLCHTVLCCAMLCYGADVGLGVDCEEALADVGCNADLYVVRQESTNLLREAHMGDGRLVCASSSYFMGQDPAFYFQFQSLTLSL